MIDLVTPAKAFIEKHREEVDGGPKNMGKLGTALVREVGNLETREVVCLLLIYTFYGPKYFALDQEIKQGGKKVLYYLTAYYTDNSGEFRRFITLDHIARAELPGDQVTTENVKKGITERLVVSLNGFYTNMIRSLLDSVFKGGSNV